MRYIFVATYARNSLKIPDIDAIEKALHAYRSDFDADIRGKYSNIIFDANAQLSRNLSVPTLLVNETLRFSSFQTQDTKWLLLKASARTQLIIPVKS